MPRYVILMHQTPAGDPRPTHWDFMLETGDSLRTWALELELRPDQTVAARRLADHRLDYLTYEGEVSGGRGSVTRWDAGEYELLSQSHERLVVSLTGQRIAGVATLTRISLDNEESLAAQRFSVSLRKS